jgi:pimeloyl-ACP methyl ester carboxylesterase
VDEVNGYVSIGYPFGLMASVLFGRHHDAILKSEKPKLFIMGTKDGFTSVKQLQNKLKSAAGRADTHLIGTGHFQMKGPAFDAQMVEIIVKFINSLPK